MFDTIPSSLSTKLDLQSLASPILITGAAYTGKSQLANLALRPEKPAAVFGTGIELDDEFKKRIQELKSDRPAIWESFDCGEQLLEALAEQMPQYRQLVVDSINQWLANLSLKAGQSMDHQQLEAALLHEGRQLCSIIEEYQDSHRWVLVSSEVGAGLSPPSQLARIFRQATSRINCQLAARCRSVVLVSAGIPMLLKGSPRL